MDVAARLAARSGIISGHDVASELKKAVAAVADLGDGMILSLPSSIIIGQAGRTGSRITPKALLKC